MTRERKVLSEKELLKRVQKKLSQLTLLNASHKEKVDWRSWQHLFRDGLAAADAGYSHYGKS